MRACLYRRKNVDNVVICVIQHVSRNLERVHSYGPNVYYRVLFWWVVYVEAISWGKWRHIEFNEDVVSEREDGSPGSNISKYVLFRSIALSQGCVNFRARVFRLYGVFDVHFSAASSTRGERKKRKKLYGSTIPRNLRCFCQSLVWFLGLWMIRQNQVCYWICLEVKRVNLQHQRKCTDKIQDLFGLRESKQCCATMISFIVFDLWIPGYLISKT